MYSENIYSIYQELVVYKRHFKESLCFFIQDYVHYWKIVRNYNRVAKSKWKKKSIVKNSNYIERRKINKNSPRAFLLFLIQTFRHIRTLRMLMEVFTEKLTIILTYFELEKLDRWVYPYKILVEEYNLDPELFKEDLLSYEDLILCIKERVEGQILNLKGNTQRQDSLIEEGNTLYFHTYIRSMVKKYIVKWRRYFNKIKKKKALKPGALVYFLINRKYKKRRRLHIGRLNKIHWYIPNYIYFDVRTLRGTLLYVPRANEIVLPFKCSLFKIYSFYKALGV